jgi:cytochrome c-type biogenesis protein CcsB
MSSFFFFELTLGCYLVGTILFLLYLVSKRERLSKVCLGVTGVGFFFHSSALVSRTVEAGYIPLTNLYESMSFFSWALILAFLVVEYRYRIHVLGSFILPLAFVSVTSAAFFPREIQSLDPIFQSTWFGIHTTLALLGMVSFAIAFVAGVMYLIQERLLKSKRFNSVYYKLPSLDILDDLNQKAISFGFPLLTLGIVTGALWAEFAWGTYWSWDPKQTFSLITWLFYLAVLHGRLTVGWRAKKAAYLAIIGFVGVVFTYLGVNLLLKGLHSFV